MLRTGARYNLLPPILLVALTGIIYGQVIDFEFIQFDDDQYILNDPTVREGLSLDGIQRVWTHSYYFNWHPVTTLSWMLDVQFWGLNPGAIHLVNVIYHTLNALLVFLVLKRMTGCYWRSATVAVLFATHPIHAQSVAWVSSRKDLLFQFFGLLSLYAYVRFQNSRSGWWYVASLALYSMSMLAKQMLVTFAFLLVLLDFWPLRRMTVSDADSTAVNKSPAGIPRLITEKVPFLALGIIFSMIAYMTQDHHGAVNSSAEVSLLDRISNLPSNYVHYLSNAFVPFRISLFYPNTPTVFGSFKFWYSLCLMLGMSAAAAIFVKKFPSAFVGWFWFVGTLFPVSGIIPLGRQLVADRYAYFPMVGIYLAATWLSYAAFSRLRVSARLGQILGVGLLGILVIVSSSQARIWRSTSEVFEHAHRCYPDDTYLLCLLGTHYCSSGKLAKAASYFQEALDSAPDDPAIHISAGSAFHEAKQLTLAAHHYEKALQLPNSGSQKLYYHAGMFFQDIGQNDRALEFYSKGLEIAKDPDYVARFRVSAATVHFANGQHDLARDELLNLPKGIGREVESLAMHNLGVLEASQGRLREATSCFAKAIALNPGNAEAYFFLGRAYLEQNRKQKAVDALNKAVSCDPGLSEAREALLKPVRNAATVGHQNENGKP